MQRKNSRVWKILAMKIYEQRPIYIIDCDMNVFKKPRKLTGRA
jgi:hypothetical protein